jgi:hypothetical protein
MFSTQDTFIIIIMMLVGLQNDSLTFIKCVQIKLHINNFAIFHCVKYSFTNDDKFPHADNASV